MSVFPINPAPTDTQILPAIANRWSPVVFSSKKVEEEKVKQLFEAARWAPSSYNEQPWRYVYAHKDDEAHRGTLENLLMNGNSWAKEAGLLIIVFASTTFSRNNKENYNADYDTGCATGYMLLQLESLGLIGHEMAGFKKEEANATLNVPATYKPMAMVAIGYPGDINAADPQLVERDAAPRERKTIEEFAFEGEWGERIITRNKSREKTGKTK